MKSGLYVGYQETLEFDVTEDMCPEFGGQRVHATLSTVSLVYYMEWVARRVILPFLEPHEEGIGAAVEVRHAAPAPVGTRVRLLAEVTECSQSKVICKVNAEHKLAQVGYGSVVQAILPREKILERIDAMRIPSESH